MTTPTAEGFENFLNNQTATKAIDHRLWATCAVGKYTFPLGTCADRFADELEDSHPDIYLALDNLDINGTPMSNNTYGGILRRLDFIREHGIIAPD